MTRRQDEYEERRPTRGRALPTTADYPASGLKLPDFDGESARNGAASCLATAISPSYTAERVASAPHVHAYAVTPARAVRMYVHRTQRRGGCAIARRTAPRAASRGGAPAIPPQMPWLMWLIKLVSKFPWVCKKAVHVFLIDIYMWLSLVKSDVPARGVV